MIEKRVTHHGEEPDPPEAGRIDARSAAEYLGDMIGQMESLARAQGFDLLVYLLSMARVESETLAGDMGSRRRPQGRSA